MLTFLALIPDAKDSGKMKNYYYLCGRHGRMAWQ
jgi:hypothetical protein